MSVKYLEKMLGSSENWKGLLKNTNEELLRMYGEQKAVDVRSVMELVKSVATRLLGRICISSGLFQKFL